MGRAGPLQVLSDVICSLATSNFHREEGAPQDLRARCHLYLGVGR